MIKVIPGAFLIWLLLYIQSGVASEWSGYVSYEGRGFNHDAAVEKQSHSFNSSISASPEYYTSWKNDDLSLTFRPFVRIDQHDKERSHADIRELMFSSNFDNWELRAGIGKVYWGVTESQHLVDIINQTDLLESLDGEEKLGQPMINLILLRDWGTIDLFVMPYFRERTFAGEKGRLRSQPYVDTSQASYQSDKKENNIDYAIRYSHSIGDWELGLSHFYGTSREPDFNIGLNNDAEPVLTPYYRLLHQTGIDLQYISGDWLWKLESVSRRSRANNYSAHTFGFEYTSVGIFDSNKDLGMIAEYLHDSRGDDASTPFEHDVLLGARYVFNDTQSTEILFGIITDTKNQERSYSIEASRRITDNWSVNLESRVFSNIRNDSILRSLHKDDYVQLELLYYF